MLSLFFCITARQTPAGEEGCEGEDEEPEQVFIYVESISGNVYRKGLEFKFSQCSEIIFFKKNSTLINCIGETVCLFM